MNFEGWIDKIFDHINLDPANSGHDATRLVKRLIFK